MIPKIGVNVEEDNAETCLHLVNQMIPGVGLFIHEFKDGSRHWYYDGVRHRDDGPAVEDSDGYLRWYVRGKLHREDGPAVVNPSGNNFWHLNARQYSEEEYNLLMFMKCDIL